MVENWVWRWKRDKLEQRQCNDSREKQATCQVKRIYQTATSFTEFHYLQNRFSFLSSRPTPNLQILRAKCRVSFWHKEATVDHTQYQQQGRYSVIFHRTYSVARADHYSCIVYRRLSRLGDRIPAEARFSATVQTGPGAHPASCTIGTRYLSRGNQAGAWRWTTHLILALMLKKEYSNTSTPHLQLYGL